MKPCPKCGTPDALGISEYDHGWKHVECDMECGYMGPGQGSILMAIREHNAHVAALSNGGEHG